MLIFWSRHSLPNASPILVAIFTFQVLARLTAGGKAVAGKDCFIPRLTSSSFSFRLPNGEYYEGVNSDLKFFENLIPIFQILSLMQPDKDKAAGAFRQDVCGSRQQNSDEHLKAVSLMSNIKK